MLLKLSVTFGVLYYLFTIIPLSDVIASITVARANYVAMALLIALFMPYAASYRMKIFTDKQGMNLSIRQLYEINLITRFYSIFLPGHLAAGVIRWYKLSQPDKHAEALASIAFSRFIDTIVLIVLGICFWQSDITSKSNDFIGLSLLIILTGLLILYYFVFNKRGFSSLQNHLRKFPSPRIPRSLQGKISRLLISTRRYQYLSGGSLIFVSGLSLVIHLLGILIYYFFARSLEIDISYITLGFLRSFVLIVGMLPISFSNLGVREGMLILFLQPYEVSASDAMALSLLLFGTTLLCGGIGGVLEAKALFPANPFHWSKLSAVKISSVRWYARGGNGQLKQNKNQRAVEIEKS